jgi:hypothetical protein
MRDSSFLELHMERASDPPDGPLFRVRLDVTTQIFDRARGVWLDHTVSPGPQYTVVRRGDTIDLQTAQPILALDDIPLRAWLQEIGKKLKL